MRTTVRLNDQLMKEVQKLAHDSGRTFTAVLEEALREKLARQREAAPRAHIRLPTFKGDGLRPGVDLDDNAGLLDRMERDRGPA